MSHANVLVRRVLHGLNRSGSVTVLVRPAGLLKDGTGLFLYLLEQQI